MPGTSNSIVDDDGVARSLKRRKILQREKLYLSSKQKAKTSDVKKLWHAERDPILAKYQKEKAKLKKAYKKEKEDVLGVVKDKYDPLFETLDKKYLPKMETIKKRYAPRIERIESKLGEKMKVVDTEVQNIEDSVGLDSCSFCETMFTEADHVREGTTRNYDASWDIEPWRGYEIRCPTCVKFSPRYCDGCDRRDIPEGAFKACPNAEQDTCDGCEYGGPIKYGCDKCVKVRTDKCAECSEQFSTESLCKGCWKDNSAVMECGVRVHIYCISEHEDKCCKEGW